jgi:hypothetical protein
MAEYWSAFLWLVDDPTWGGVGGNFCSKMDGWDEHLPLSEGLWQKFVDWVAPFDDTTNEHYTEEFDWTAFNARGIQLACWLKEEVGDNYRVIYINPHPGPEHGERKEIIGNGMLKPLLSFRAEREKRELFNKSQH